MPYGPSLTSNSERLACPSTPTSIRLSRNEETLLVGCADGSVLQFVLTPTLMGIGDMRSALLRPDPMADAGPVTALCEMGRCLLVGRANGRIETALSAYQLPMPALETGAPVRYIGVLDEGADAAIVGLQDHPAAVWEAYRRGLARVRWVAAHDAPIGICHAHSLSHDTWWLVSSRGGVFALSLAEGEYTCRRIFDLTDGRDSVSTVFDVGTVRTYRHADRTDVYVATDLGVFRLRHGDGDPMPLLIHLPGPTGVCVALACHTTGRFQYLWAADTGGGVHLFWTDDTPRTADATRPQAGLWRQTGIRHSAADVVGVVDQRAQSASWIVAASCRDDAVIVMKYGETPEPRGLVGGRGESVDSTAPALPTWLAFADAIEQLGSAPAALRQFLGNPEPGDAVKSLRAIPAADRPRALELWMHTFLGVVHRFGEGDREPQYLGILRWLRRVQHEIRGDPDPPTDAHFEALTRFAEKWGLFGASPSRRVRPLSPLAREGTRSEDAELESVVHDSLRFSRSYDLDPMIGPEAGGDRRSKGRARSCCHAAFKPRVEGRKDETEEERDYVAVSWASGGVELYSRRSGTTEEWTSVVNGRGQPPSGHSHHIILHVREINGETRLALIESFVAEPNAGPLPVRVRWLSKHGGTWDVSRSDPQPAAGSGGGRPRAARTESGRVVDPDAESVCSMALLGPDHLVLGMQGSAGCAQIAVARIEKTGQVTRLTPKVGADTLPHVYPTGRRTARNPTWAIATLTSHGDGRFDIVVGSADGVVQRVALQLTADSYNKIAQERIGRLRDPVRAVACDPTPGSVRVFAGSSSGALVAWQWIDCARPAGSAPRSADPGDAPRTRTPADACDESAVDTTPAAVSIDGSRQPFVLLWATQEDAQIAGIHVTSTRSEDVTKVVVAVTRNNRVIVFDNRRIAQQATEEHRRVKVPGTRLGRIDVGPTCSASCVVPGGLHADPAPGDHSPELRLAVGGIRGGFRVVTLHYLRYTESRRTQYESLRSRWKVLLARGETRPQFHLLRLSEAVYAACPQLTLTLARWIVPVQRERARRAADGVDRIQLQRWLPRHLKPLTDIETLWTGGDVDKLVSAFGALLDHAHRLGDRDLFEEAVHIVLGRANVDIFSCGRSEFANDFSDPARFFEGYVRLLDVVHSATARWSDRHETGVKIRIVVTKHLLDGDAFYRLSRLARPSSRKRDLPRHLRSERVLKAARAALRARVQHVESMLNAGDPLLALEALRASNLSILRACLRLDRTDWKPSTARGAIPWEALERFYSTLGDFAARTIAPQAEGHAEALAHEVARAYAVGVVACPESAVRLADWITESGLSTGMSERVRDQIVLIQKLTSLRLPRATLRLFAYVSGIKSDWTNADGLGQTADTAAEAWDDPHQVGRDAADLWVKRQPFLENVRWTRQMADDLRNDPASAVKRLRERNFDRGSPSRGTDDHYRHSRAFWDEELRKLQDVRSWFEELQPPPRRRPQTRPGADVRPQVIPPVFVLASTGIRDWCKRARENLATLFANYQIFEPEYTAYDAALSSLESASEGFARSTSVQANLVLGVLGHGLLEMLDEHILELWEMAQALDPRLTWDWADGIDSDPSEKRTAARFARYLLMTARRAESIPKNLRLLQGLLAHARPAGARPPGAAPPQTQRGGRFGALLVREFPKWRIVQGAGADFDLRAREHSFLRLALSELDQNDRQHGCGAHAATKAGAPAEEEKLAKFRPTVEFIPQTRHVVTMKFPFGDPSDPRVARRIRRRLANDVFGAKMQGMVSPDPQANVPSYGTGLYLAALAAAAVGWRLQFTQGSSDIPHMTHLEFQLERVDVTGGS